MLPSSLVAALSGSAGLSRPRREASARPSAHTHLHARHFHPLALSMSTTTSTSTRAVRLPSVLAYSAQPPPTEKPGLKLLCGAGVTVVYEFALGHYLEFIKIMKQTRPQHSYVYLTKDIMHAKGLVGIWDGFLPWGVVQGLAKGSFFAWGHSMTYKLLQPHVEDGTLAKGAAEVIAGGIGGGFQGLALSPTLLLKTRVMTDPVFREHMTPMETASRSMKIGMKVIQNEGALALMKGSGVFSLKRVADWSTRFFFSVQAENFIYKRDNPERVLTIEEKIISSLVGGTCSSLVTLPMDVMVAQIQQASKAGAKVSIAEVFREQYKAGGVKQIVGFATTGLTVRLLHVAFTTMIMKTATSVVYDMVEGRS